MQKISSQDAKTVLKQASAAIRHLTRENQDLAQKLAQVEQERRITKIAQEMEAKGLNSDLTLEEKVAQLRGTNLSVVEEAVKMSAPNIKLASVSDDMAGATAASAFENFILTGETESE